MMHTFIPSRDEEPVLDGIDEFILIIFCSLLNFLNLIIRIIFLLNFTQSFGKTKQMK